MQANGNKMSNDLNIGTNKLLIQTYFLSFFKGAFELILQCFEQEEYLIQINLLEKSENFTPLFKGLLIFEDDLIRNQLQDSLVKIIDLD